MISRLGRYDLRFTWLEVCSFRTAFATAARDQRRFMLAAACLLSPAAEFHGMGHAPLGAIAGPSAIALSPRRYTLQVFPYRGNHDKQISAQ
jgi:hypothetical protein